MHPTPDHFPAISRRFPTAAHGRHRPLSVGDVVVIGDVALAFTGFWWEEVDVDFDAVTKMDDEAAT